jgi:hypothetical protein
VISAKRITAVVLCALLLNLPVLGEPQAGGQRAGQIDAMIPAATRNDVTAKPKEDIDWNDLLKTTKSGRVRASLLDGSILSVGSDSQLRVVQHDAASQQTSLEMNYGKLRSQVQKITQPGGKFEVKTPNAVIGAIGTDFYVAFASNRTTVICYEGRVSVTPLGNVQVLQNSGQTNAANNSITVNQGQMVVISNVVPPGGFQTSDTPPALQQGTQLATQVPTNPPGEVRPGVSGHAHTWIFIASAAAVGAAAGILATRNVPSSGQGKCPIGVAVC